ncbi:hypothetical protein UFOVP645_4 [uncultured Caudovirales phage]|uniref:Uncharacterized protein n=1 Tax=uncultured Caudovirales phage TaxID=2100421 RepID=A0A6J5NAK1_9CAUD|nr:hypothetical protein UFOVP645_4 [uncultured Caudovirales phage]
MANIFELQSVVEAMKVHWPSKQTNHKKVALGYIKQCQKALTQGILLASHWQIKHEEIPVSWRELRFACGKYGPKTNQQYWFDWFQANYPLLIKIKTGYSFGKKGTLTMVKTTREIDRILSSQDPAETFKAFYQDEVDSPMDWVAIDLASLNGYIRHNENITDRNQTLDDNLKQARVIFDIATYCNGQLPQVISLSEFGRKYYRGPNLQSCPKIIRHAALGNCHQYDIEASVFTWKFDTSKELMPEIKLPATLDYLDFKQKHRERLAKLVFGNQEDWTVNTIKRCITAIGFGARSTNAVWVGDNGKWTTTALRDIIHSKEYLDKFLKDPLISEFIQEQEAMNYLIFNSVKSNPHIKNNKNCLSDSGRLSRNRTMSYLYQQTESSIIKQLMRVAEPGNILLLCHDGFYTKNRADLSEMRYVLRTYLPNGNLDHTEIQGFKFLDHSDEHLHKQFIHKQESDLRKEFGKLTKDYFPKSIIQKQSYKRQDDHDDGTCPNGYYEPMLDEDEDEEV